MNKYPDKNIRVSIHLYQLKNYKMDILNDFYDRFIIAYNAKMNVLATELIYNLFMLLYEDEMLDTDNEYRLTRETISLYLKVLHQQNILLPNADMLSLYLLKPLKKELLQIEDEDDD